MGASGNLICAIVVTYNPSFENLLSLIAKLSDQQCDVLLVDNSEHMIDDLVERVTYYKWLGGNKGIAVAQNIGIKESLKGKYPFTIFFDQDSNIADNFIRTLLKPMSCNDYEICAPIFYDEKHGFEYAITDVKSNGKRKKIYSNGKNEIFTSSVVISSGTLVRTEIFNTVGMMDDGLFIDYVDTEWCLRCFSKNILVHIIPQAKMIHSIGDNSFNFFGFTVPVHSPMRRYYRVRNSIHLLRYKHVPKLLALREITFCIIHSILLILNQRNKRDYLYSFLVGVRDGILNVRGEKPKP